MTSNPGDIYTGDDVLQVMSEKAINRNNAVEQLIRDEFRLQTVQQPKKILEIGPGHGEFINRFQAEDQLTTYIIEKDPQYFQQLSTKHQGFQDIEEPADNTFDFVYLIDVLEHIEKDEEILAAIFRKLKPGGKLLIYVPARMELFSAFDKKIGHYRRYHKKELLQKLQTATFDVNRVQYHDVIGYFAAYYNKWVAKDGALNAKMVGIYDKYLFPVTNNMEKLLPFPIGKSLFAVATKAE